MLSPDRENHLARLMADRLMKKGLIQFEDADQVLKYIKIGVSAFAKEWHRLDREAQEKIKTLKRGVLEGTPEWDILHERYFEESYRKQSFNLIKK